MIVTTSRALELKRILHLSAGQCAAHRALEAVNFLPITSPDKKLILKIL